MHKPYAQSSEDNKQVILAAIKSPLQSAKTLLEIGSGTGQHAVYFAEHLPHLIWQPSELSDSLAAVKMWVDDADLKNIKPVCELDVSSQDWCRDWGLTVNYDAAFTANTLHIMSLGHVEKLFLGLTKVLAPGALFFSYGPFNYNGQFTSESNARFDLWLKQRDAQSGVRDLDDLSRFAAAANIVLINDIEMPANNRILVWQKQL